MVDVEKQKQRKVGFTEVERRTKRVTQTLTAKLEAEQAKKRKKENPRIKELEKRAEQLEASGMTKSAERIRSQIRSLS